MSKAIGGIFIGCLMYSLGRFMGNAHLYTMAVTVGMLIFFFMGGKND